MGRPIKLDKERDKERTKQKLVAAVGEILSTKGYTGLGVNKIAKQAGVNKKLIYRYFGSVDNLIEEFISERDYWLALSKRIDETLKNLDDKQESNLISSILEEEFKFFFNEAEMQKIILWQISEDKPLLRSISNARESMAGDVLKLTDPHFLGSNVNFRAVSALLVGGIYYTILHAKTNKSTVCEIDVNLEKDRDEVIKTIKQIIHWAYRAVNDN